jgi:hypothetical protein
LKHEFEEVIHASSSWSLQLTRRCLPRGCAAGK